MTAPARHEHIALILLLATYLLVGALYATQTPPWQVPDEPAHYNYIAQLHADGCCPVMEAGDYDQDYLSALTASRFDPALTDRLGALRYENHQPPLYYLLLLPAFALFGGDLIALRLCSVVIGAGVVLMAWATVRALFPARPWFALTAAAFVAFLPQHAAMMGGVNNDSLAEFWIGAALLACVRYVRGVEEDAAPAPHPALLGALAGLAVLTKTTAAFIVAVALAAAWLRWRQERAQRAVPLRSLVVAVLWISVVAAAINTPWWLRNASVYGGLDIAGLGRHDAVVALPETAAGGQPRTGDWIAQQGAGALLSRFVRFTFNSFWGQFGWMAAPMPDWVYAVLLGFVVVVMVGLALALRRNQREQETITAGQRGGVALLALASALVVAQYLYYNLTFVQHQGRYLFPALIPISLVVALGLDGWVRPVGGRFNLPMRVRWVPPALVWISFAALSLYALFRVVVPALAP